MRTWLLVIAGLLGLVAPVAVRHAPALQDFEWASYDWRVRNVSATAPASRVTLALIDEVTLEQFDQEFQIRWPFPRGIYPFVLQALQHHGAEAASFDVLFIEDDDFDPDFAAALKQFPTYLATTTDGATAQASTTPVPWPVVVDGLQATNREAIEPLVPNATLRGASAGGGHIDHTPDRDGVTRSAQLLAHDGQQISPSLSLATWLGVQELGMLSATDGQLHMGNVSAPLSSDLHTIIPWRPLGLGPGAFDSVSFKDLVVDGMLLAEGREPLIDNALLRDRVVFIGPSAAGLFDLRATPVGREDLGVRVHASTFDALDRAQFVVRVPAWVEHLVTLIAVVALAWACLSLSKVHHQASLTISLLALWLSLSCGLFYFGSVWISMTGPMAGLFITFAITAVGNYLTEGKERRFIRNSFQHYLSPVVIEQLVDDPRRLQLGGERKEITAMFTDLAGFTTLSESMDPSALVDLLNEYLTEMTDIIMEEGGTVDKYEGDAIIAMFGAPLDQVDHAQRACRAAVRCQRKLDDLRHQWADRELPPLHMRIGLNSGPAVVGNLGSHQRFDYTMIGDTVNLAARLEGANKVYGTYTMISGATWALARDELIGRQLDLVAVKGKAEGVPVHEIIGLVSDPADDQRDQLISDYQTAFQDYTTQDFSTASATFAKLAAAHGDPASKLFAERCDQLIATPPGDEWDGVFRMTTK